MDRTPPDSEELTVRLWCMDIAVEYVVTEERAAGKPLEYGHVLEGARWKAVNEVARRVYAEVMRGDWPEVES